LVNKKFPSLKNMTQYAHSKGMLAGFYMNNCECSENMFTDPAMIARVVERSVAMLAAAGFDSLKLDSGSQFNNMTLWAELLNATGRAFEIENCHQGGLTPGQVVPGQECTGTVGVSDCPYSMYRTSDDVYPTWGSVLNNVNSLVAFLGDDEHAPRSRPGECAPSAVVRHN
jgi:hypothetical protein